LTAELEARAEAGWGLQSADRLDQPADNARGAPFAASRDPVTGVTDKSVSAV
jgi:hypothetical protein